MQMLGNLVFGAILAGLSLGPAAWADVRHALDRPVAHAVALLAAPSRSPFGQAVASARGALHLPAGLRN